jgi:hypothetical protein
MGSEHGSMQPLIAKPKANVFDDAAEPGMRTAVCGARFARAITFSGHGPLETGVDVARSVTLIGDGSCVPGGRPNVSTLMLYFPAGSGGMVSGGMQAGSCGVASLRVSVQP